MHSIYGNQYLSRSLCGVQAALTPRTGTFFCSRNKDKERLRQSKARGVSQAREQHAEKHSYINCSATYAAEEQAWPTYILLSERLM